MQHRVGRPLECDGNRDGIFKGLAAQHVTGFEAQFDKISNRGSGVVAVLFFIFTDGVLSRTARQRQTECLHRRSHCVGGIHPATGARSGDGSGFNFSQFDVRYPASGVSAYGFKYRDDVASFGTRQNRAAIHKDTGAVHACHSNSAGRHILIAATDGHKPVKALGADHGFDRVCNNLTRYQ